MRIWPWLFPPACDHDWSGVANYYDRDLKVFLHLVRCTRCGCILIHEH